MAVLKVLKGNAPEQILELREERVVFGRHPNCQIVLDNAAVSRHHAQILESHGSYFLEDLRSRNGTQLNGKSIEGRAELSEADEITVCDFVFRFHERVPPPDDLPSTATKKGKKASVSRKALADDSIRGTLNIETGATVFAVGEEPIDDDSSQELSSIITRLDVQGSSSDLRLGIQPELKLRAILEISSTLGQTLNLNEILKRILEGLFKIFPQADEGFVLLKDTERKRLVVKATKTRTTRADAAVPISMTIVKQAMKTGEAILSANAADDQRFRSSESISQLRIRSMLCAPLVGKAGDSLGVIQITTADMRQNFTQEDLDVLVSVASQASLAIENASLHEQMLKQRDLERDLEFATQVQLGFLPNERPKVPGYEFSDFYEAAQRVGGDYFDYIPLPGGRIAVALGDVAGKGVPAALLMARLYSSARFHLMTQATPSAALTGLNTEIASSGLGHRFITFVVVVIDPQTHTATVANAGHLPVLRRNAKGSVEPLAQKESGMPLGIVPRQEFQDVTIKLDRGDTLLFYTDGVTEAMNADKQIYGGERLVEFLSKGPEKSEDLVRAIVADVEAFGKEQQQRDDMCLVCVRRVK